MIRQVVAKCSELGVVFRKNGKSKYSKRYLLILTSGVVGFDRIDDVMNHLQTLEKIKG